MSLGWGGHVPGTAGDVPQQEAFLVRAFEAADDDAYEEGWEGTDAEGDWVSCKDTWSPERFVKCCKARGVTFVRRSS